MTVRAKRVVQLTRDGRSSEDRIQLGRERGDTTKCPSQGLLSHHAPRPSPWPYVDRWAAEAAWKIGNVY